MARTPATAKRKRAKRAQMKALAANSIDRRVMADGGEDW